MIDANGNRNNWNGSVELPVEPKTKHERKESKSKEKKEHKSKFLKVVSKFASAKFVNKQLLKKEPQLKVVISQPVTNSYHSIYFKTEYEQDRRNLFFK